MHKPHSANRGSADQCVLKVSLSYRPALPEIGKSALMAGLYLCRNRCAALEGAEEFGDVGGAGIGLGESDVAVGSDHIERVLLEAGFFGLIGPGELVHG